MKQHLLATAVAMGSALSAIFPGPVRASSFADTIYFGGPILTMNDAQPTAEALAVANGEIMSVGASSDVLTHRSPSTRMIDLEGKALLPGFIDPHGHVSLVGLQAASANLLPAPDGQGNSIAALNETLCRHMEDSSMPEDLGVVVGFGYDDSQLSEGRHPTRRDFDEVARDMPILTIHQSFHLGSLNSKALEIVGFNADTPDPPGGKIWREPNSQEPSGVVEEAAFFYALSTLLAGVGPDLAQPMLIAGQDLYLSYGYTTIQDGRASAAQIAVAKTAARDKLLKADIVAYPDVFDPATPALMAPPWFRDVSQPPEYVSGFRIGGVKLTLDGSPQGKTAWLTRPYFKPPAGEDPDYAGHGVVSDEQALAAITMALRNRWQILIHANGDRAIDQMLDRLQESQSVVEGNDVRPVLIHGQTLREDQVDRLKDLGVFPSLFPMHTFYWGDWHRQSVLGPKRAENISPTGWLVQREMMFSTHHDAPVALPNSIRVMSSTVNRTTRSGYVLGRPHRVAPSVALKAMTLWPAHQHFEAARKGSLEAGKLADLVILSRSPLDQNTPRIDDIKVVETIKEGKTVYQVGSPPPPRVPCMPSRRRAP